MSSLPPAAGRPEVLFISKPLVEPWNDSAKLVVRDQVTHGERYRYRVLTPPDAPSWGPEVTNDPVYAAAGPFRPRLLDKARVLGRCLRPGPAAIVHYVFAPNPLTSTVGRVARRLSSGVRTVQTVPSAPRSYEGVARLLFTDRVLAMSRDTLDKLAAAGVPRDRLRLVRPGIVPLAPPDASEIRRRREELGFGPGPLVVYPGDYEFSRAAAIVAQAAPAILRQCPEATLVFACRLKTGEAAQHQRRIDAELTAAGLAGRYRFINRLPAMPLFLGAVDLVVMPAESLFAKMDAPLVILEAMSQRVPCLVADVPPLSEIVELGGASPIPPDDPGRLADEVLRLIADPGQQAELGARAEAALHQHFSAHAMAAAVEAVYDELLGRERSPAS